MNKYTLKELSDPKLIGTVINFNYEHPHLNGYELSYRCKFWDKSSSNGMAPLSVKKTLLDSKHKFFGIELIDDVLYYKFDYLTCNYEYNSFMVEVADLENLGLIDTYELPKRWYVNVGKYQDTPLYREIVNWRLNTNHPGNPWVIGIYLIETGAICPFEPTDRYNYIRTKITMDQFIKYVLKKDSFINSEKEITKETEVEGTFTFEEIKSIVGSDISDFKKEFINLSKTKLKQ